MDKLKLLEVLRYALAGGVALGTFIVRHNGAIEWITAHEKLLVLRRFLASSLWPVH